MTETSCFASLFPYPEHDNTGSVGKFLPNLDVKLINEDGEEAEDYGKPGELCIRGPTVVRGYFGNEEASRGSFDREGYFRTGDVMFCERGSGKWFIVDRKKVCFILCPPVLSWSSHFHFPVFSTNDVYFPADH